MAAIAERTGIGRATLYRYFSDVDAVLGPWHERLISRHVDQLIRLKDGDGTALERLEAVLGAYAMSQYERPHDGVAASLRSGPHVDDARQRLEAVVSELSSRAATDGAVRADVGAGELARFCLHALGARAACVQRWPCSGSSA